MLGFIKISKKFRFGNAICNFSEYKDPFTWQKAVNASIAKGIETGIAISTSKDIEKEILKNIFRKVDFVISKQFHQTVMLYYTTLKPGSSLLLFFYICWIRFLIIDFRNKIIQLIKNCWNLRQSCIFVKYVLD